MRALLLTFCLICAFDSHALSLKQAQQLALDRANEIKQLNYRASALEDEAIFSHQLPDPNLQLGALNLPTNSFSLSQEMMSQIQLSVFQRFPKGHSLQYSYLIKKHLAAATYEQRNLAQRMIIKVVRQLWVKLYLWQKSEQKLKSQLLSFEQLEQVSSSMFANNKAPQKDVLNAQLEVSQLRARILDVQQAHQDTSAELERWLGSAAIKNINHIALPNWMSKVSISDLMTSIKEHPALAMSVNQMNAQQSQVELVKQDYLPEITAGIAYGYRQGTAINGMKKPDFMSAMLQVSMPLFTKNKQHKKLMASQKIFSAKKEKLYQVHKELRQMAQTGVIDFNNSKQQILLYQDKLVPQSKQFAKSTLIAYQNTKADFINVAESHVRRLNIELALLSQQIKNRQAQINILYIKGQ